MKIHCFINFFASIHEADESVAIYFDSCLLATADQVLRSRKDKKPPTVSTIMDLSADELEGKKNICHTQAVLLWLLKLIVPSQIHTGNNKL